MRWTRTATPAAVALLLTGCGGHHAGRTAHSSLAVSCAGPTLRVSPSTVHAGERVHVSGEFYATDCFDQGQQGTPPASTGMTVEVVQPDRHWTVATGVDATGEQDSIARAVTVPAGLRPGPAEVRVSDHSTSAIVQVVGG